jgi:hypothetical protein
MGVKSVAKGGEGDSDLRAARPDDGRDNGSPRPVPGSERGREGRPAQLWGRRKGRVGQPPVGAAAMRRGATFEEPPQAQRGRPRTASAVQPAKPKPRDRASADD